MKSCCDRYSFGVTIATIYILISVIVFILNCIIYVQNNAGTEPLYNNHMKSEALKTIIISLVTALISAIFIVAIVKRFQYFVIPWLILTIYIFYLTCEVVYSWYIGFFMGGAPLNQFLILILFTLIAIGVQIAIFWFSCSLFNQIRNEKTGSATIDDY
ncbi:uncharacterized protein ACRADG_010677 [Cochliomyia hominivorax]